MNYYPFHLGDYAAHTAHLEPMEDLAYRRMLDLYYRTERPLPREIDQIARLIRLKGYEREIESVIGEFFEDCSEGWAHVRCDEEITKMQDKQAKARASAQASVNARSANAQRTLNERSADAQLPTPTPTPKKEPPNPRKRGQVSARFEEFWLAWPKNERKQDKAKCAEHWRRHDLDAEADAVLADVRVKRGTEKWRDGFIEAPLVYLRGKRWQDGVTPNDGPAEALDWRATWKTIVAKGVELGCGEWSEELQIAGKAPDFPAYRARVERKVRELEAPPDEAGQQRIAGLMGGLKVVG